MKKQRIKSSREVRVLIVDDERNIHYSFQKILPSEYQIISAESAEDGIRLLREVSPNIVIMDVRLPEMNGLEALKQMRKINEKIPIVMMTAFGTMNTAITAMKFGAFEYLLKPFDVHRMSEIVERALENSEMMQRQVYVGTPSPPDGEENADAIVGSSEQMQEVYKLIGQVATQDVTVLIRGESGTGKELVARAIYQHSNRASKPFMEINCAAIPDNLLESELFGYEKGAFTGASERRIGKFEQVNNGTLFLDEIGEMSMMTQAKVLRLIQYGEFTRIGGSEVIKTNVRLLVATNRNLEEAIQAGDFREDLFYRLNIITINLPPLRDRKQDIEELVRYFIGRHSQDGNREIEGIYQEAMEHLQSHNWPGNVRQLENEIRRAIVLCKGTKIGLDDLELDSASAGNETLMEGDATVALAQVFDRILTDKGRANVWQEVESLLIRKTLEKTKGNQVQAARILGIHRNTLRNRIVKYKLDS